MTLRKKKKILIISSLLIFIFSITIIKNKNLVNRNLVLAQYYPSKQTACKLSYETYEMLMGGYSKLITGNKEDSYRFPGFSFFEYMVPQCASWNNDGRPKLFDYKINGGFYIQGNMVTNGYKTFFSGDGHGISLNSFMRSNGSVGSEDNINYMRIGNKNNISISQISATRDTWLYHGNEDDNFLGASVFLNSKTSKIKLDSYSIEPRNDGKIVSSTLDVSPDGFGWEEWKEDTDLALNNPTDFEFEYLSGENAKGSDCLIYITDKGRKKLIQYNLAEEKTEKELGDFYWNWGLEGLTIAPTTCGRCNFTKEELKNRDDDRTIYLSDSTKNRIMHTEIDGQNWATSFDNEYWDYYTNLFITGEEVFQYEKMATTTIANAGKRIILKNSGFSPKNISIISTNKVQYDTELQTSVNSVTKNNDNVFGEYSFHFDGNSVLSTEHHNSFMATHDNFFFDFWFKADNDFYTTNTIFIDYVGNMELAYDTINHKLKLSIYKIDSDGKKRLKNIITSPEWHPVIDEWYYFGVSRFYNMPTEKNDFHIYTDIEDENGTLQKMSAIGIENTAFDGNQVVLGGGLNYKATKKDLCVPYDCFKGNIDNFRFIKGFLEDKLDERVINQYYFDNPRGIAFNYANKKIYVADSKSNRIVIMDDDFKKWKILGKNRKGDGRYEFNNITDIDIHKDNFYIIDQGNQRIIKTDIVASSTNFRDLDTKYNNNSWEVLNLKNYYPNGSQNKDFYNDGDIMYDFVYKNYEGETLTASHNTQCLDFHTIDFNISDYLHNRIYGNREIYVYFDSEDINNHGNFFVQLTKKPGKTPTNNYSNSKLNLMGVNFENGVKFTLPERIDVNWNGDLYLTFGSCDDYSVKIDNIRVTMSKEFIPSAISIVDNSIASNKLFISDIENGIILDAGINPFFVTDIIHGGENPEEYYNKYVKKRGTNKIILENHRHETKFFSPIDIHVIASSDDQDTNGFVYIYHTLDSTNDKDLAISLLDDEKVDFFGTNQNRAINIKMEDGGLSTPMMDTWGMFNLWRKWYNMDYYRDNNPEFARSANSEHKIWVGRNLGPAISHCPEHKKNVGSTIFSFAGDYGTYMSCTYLNHYDATDHGQECHDHWWQAGGIIDVGVSYEECLYTNQSILSNPGSCDPWDGTAVEIDCQEITELRRKHGTARGDPPVPYSECIGQWDWYSQWPFCTYYSPAFEREWLCDILVDKCVPNGEGDGACITLGPGDSSPGVGNCVSNHYVPDTSHTCPAGGSCDLVGQCSASYKLSSCKPCDYLRTDDSYTCSEEPCTHKECPYINSLRMVNNGCMAWSYHAITNNKGNIVGWKREAVPAGCGEPPPCPNDWFLNESEECCQEWHWECQATCEPNKPSCLEGYAVRWRDDYKGVTIHHSDLDNSGNNSFTLRFFYDRNPTPYEMEKFIKDVEQEVYSPYQGHYSKIDEIKDYLSKAGIITTNYNSMYDNDEEYLDSIKNEKIIKIKFSNWD